MIFLARTTKSLVPLHHIQLLLYNKPSVHIILVLYKLALLDFHV